MASDDQAGNGPYGNAVHKFTLDCGSTAPPVTNPPVTSSPSTIAPVTTRFPVNPGTGTTCEFVAIDSSECPCSEENFAGCHLPECTDSMTPGDLCEADKTLPDGNTFFNV